MKAIHTGVGFGSWTETNPGHYHTKYRPRTSMFTSPLLLHNGRSCCMWLYMCGVENAALKIKTLACF